MKILLTQISQIADKLYDNNIDSISKEELLNRLEKLSADYMDLKRQLQIKNDAQHYGNRLNANIKEHNVMTPTEIKPIIKSETIYQPSSSKNKEQLQYMRKIRF